MTIKNFEFESNEEKEQIKSLQALLLAQEKLAALGLVTAGISHELKNPLNLIINFSQVGSDLSNQAKLLTNDPLHGIEDLKTLLDDIQECFHKIVEHGQHADKIIKSVLLGSRQDISPHEVPINELVANALKMTFTSFRIKNPQFNCQIIENYTPTSPKIYGFPGELLRVFINIFDNACFALFEKKAKAGSSYTPTLDVKTQEENGGVKIIISDNASGVPQASIDKIFEPFFTTKPADKGTGLGLFIAHDLVCNLHKGKLQVTSKQGEGTVFTVFLPTYRE